MARLNPLLLRLGRWPRRLAALACLLLAAASALTPATGTASDRVPVKRVGLADALGRDEVAVPVTLASAQAASFAHVGDRVGVLSTVDERAGPALVADHLRVLAVPAAADTFGAEDAVLLVAADRADAVRLAGNASTPALVVLDHSP